MNHQETIALLAALRAAGVSHFKSGDTDITLSNTPSTQGILTPSSSVQAASNAAVSSLESEAATEKLKELIETLKMDDSTLLDRIFPAGAGG